MRVLLTGFMPFGGHATNPSQYIVSAIAKRPADHLEIITEVLPVEYQAAGERIQALIHDIQPDAIVMLGLAAGRNIINLERVALNLDDSGLPDNTGELASGRVITDDGPAAYWSSLPLETMQQALQARDIPVKISNHAGTYVCNHVFYTARHMLERSHATIPCGFIHVPAIGEGDDTPGLPLATMIEAVETCLVALSESSQ